MASILTLCTPSHQHTDTWKRHATQTHTHDTYVPQLHLRTYTHTNADKHYHQLHIHTLPASVVVAVPAEYSNSLL